MTKPWHLAVRAQREPGCQQLTRNAECDAERPAPLPAFFVSPDVFLLKLKPRDAWASFAIILGRPAKKPPRRERAGAG